MNWRSVVVGVGGLYEVQVRIPKDSTVPADAVTNTLHFARTDLAVWTAADWAVVRGWLNTFYGVLAPQMSSALDQANAWAKVYHTADPAPRAPAFEQSIVPAGTWGTTASPDELAICLSFQATRLSGVPQSRRRGRVYIGPVMNAGQQSPSVALLSAVQAAGVGLLTSSKAHATMRWCVYSRVNNGFAYVDNGWVDNAWDVQRRRGIKPITRYPVV